MYHWQLPDTADISFAAKLLRASADCRQDRMKLQARRPDALVPPNERLQLVGKRRVNAVEGRFVLTGGGNAFSLRSVLLNILLIY